MDLYLDAGSGVTGVLIMSMYPLGNLMSYLKSATIHISAAFDFCSSLLSGLEYLHRQGEIIINYFAVLNVHVDVYFSCSRNCSS